MTASILLVEDHALNRDALSRLLVRRGYAVATAPDGETALAQVAASAPDLILMDISLPGLDGHETTRRIRDLEAGRRPIPIIALTAHAGPGHRAKALAAGCTGYATKPVDLAQLLIQMEALLLP